MRIAIDASPAMKPHRTGVARYLVNLVKGLAAVGDPGDEYSLCCRISRFRAVTHRLKISDPRFRTRWMHGWIRPRGCQVAHGTAGRLLDLPDARKVVTVHDVFSLLETSFGSDRFREKRRLMYREIAERADRIICPSSWTREQFWGHHPEVDEERIVVVPAGVEARFRPEAKAGLARLRNDHNIFGPYFVYVGEVSRRKNIVGILDALAGMPDDSPVFVLAGKPSFGHEDIEDDVEKRGLTGRILLTGFFADAELPTLLAGAVALVHPSFLEGFGLSVLEAQACGTPVVCSRRGALDETSGGIRVAVDAEDPDSIRAGMIRVLEDGDLAKSLSAKGIEWARRFRWERVAERTRHVYAEALG